MDSIRIAEKALGEVHYGLSEEEKKIAIFRRSLFVVKDVKAGDKVSEENVKSIRPGHGLHTRHIVEITGRSFKKDVARGCPLTWEMITETPG